jgi:hypothetical protein
MAGSEGRPFGLQGPLGRWRTLDRWAAGYALLTFAVLAAFGQGRAALDSLGALAIVMGMAWWTRDTPQALPTLLRLFTLPILYTFFYRQIQVLWPLFHHAPLDGHLALLEARLFGTQPSLAFQAAFPQRWLSELFCFAYVSYYFFTPLVCLTVLARKGYLAAERIILATTLCFIGCYTFFWLAPTVAPHFWFPPRLGPQPYAGYVFNHALFFFTGRGEVPGGAFPSSHVAVALLLTLWSRREAPALFPFLAGLTLLMLPAVVYLRAHYVLDVPAGLLTGLLAYHLTKDKNLI